MIGLFDHSERIGAPVSQVGPLSNYIHLAHTPDYGGLIRLGTVAKNCKTCLVAGRKTAEPA